MIENPKYFSKKFICPHCGIMAQQEWNNHKTLSSMASSVYTHAFYEYRKRIQDYEQEAVEKYLNFMDNLGQSLFANIFPSELAIAKCKSCEEISLWVNKTIVYPRKTNVEPPNLDLDDDIKALYNEAAIILNDSPKGASALLRLALQKILIQIGKKGKNINDDIKELVAEGLSAKIQKSLDILRVVGNNAVHPGQITIDDNHELATKLFKIINIIANELITKPNEIDDLYEDIIPDKTKEHIKQRDK